MKLGPGVLLNINEVYTMCLDSALIPASPLHTPVVLLVLSLSCSDKTKIHYSMMLVDVYLVGFLFVWFWVLLIGSGVIMSFHFSLFDLSLRYNLKLSSVYAR